MKQMTSLLCLVLGAAAFIAGCSSKSPTAPPANPTPSAFSISLASSTNTAGINESVLVVAQVTAGGKAVADGTSVTFRTSIGLFADNGTQEITAATVNGRATATLVSADAGDGLVEARVPGAVATIPIKFRGSDATDVAIYSVLPNVGQPSGGDQVTILGRGFRLPVKVDFIVNGEARAARDVQVNADGTQISCVTPATGVAVEPILVDVKVTTGANTTTTFVNGFTFASELGLPLLYSVNPQVGSSAGGYEIELVGKNLSTATVAFQIGAPIGVSRDAAKVSVSADGTRLRVLVPQASPNPVTTDVNVGFVITNTIGISTYPNAFTYVADKRPPVVYYLSPDRGSIQGRELVTVYGKYFVTPVKVTFVGVGDGEVQAVSPDGTQIQVLTPPVPGGASGTPAQPVDVTVVTQAQTGRDEEYTLTRAYQYLEGEQPEIYQVSPNSGPIAGGTRVTLTGKGFLSPVQVTFSGAGGDVQAVVNSVNYNQIVCVTPNMGPTNPGATAITSSVLVRNGATGKVSLPGTFRFGSSMFISAFSPGTGPDIGGTVVTIFGQGFSAPVAVSIGGVAAAIRSVSGTEVVAVTNPIPVRACASQSGPVIVTNIDTGATASSTSQFTYVPGTPLLVSAATQLGTNVIPEPGVSCSDGGTHPGWSTYTVTLNGTNFETLAGTTVSGMKVKLSTTPPVEVATTYVNSTRVTFQLPDLSFLTYDTIDCVDSGGEKATRKVPTPLDVTVINQNNSCESTLAGGLVILPCNQSCGSGAVTNPTVTLSPDPLTLIVGGSATMGVTLSTQAPAGGIVVALSSSNPAVMTVPVNVTIPAGALFTTFTVTGLSAGSTIITAALPPANGGAVDSATATVAATNYTISLDPTSLNLTVGAAGNFNVVLNTPAPPGGLLIQLSQSGAAGVIQLPGPPQVTVPAGATSAGFQVTGLGPGGPITITALLPSGVGGGSAQASVTVTQAQYTITINPQSISLPVGGMANFTATLNNPAPAGPATVVTLIQTGPTGVISVSVGSLTFNPGDTIQTFQVTGLAVGGPVSVTAALPAALGGATDTTSVTVTAPTLTMTFTPASQTIPVGGTANFNLSLSSPAPAGGAAITLNVTGPTGIISVAPLSFTIPAGATNFFPIVVTGLNLGGPVTLTAILPSALGGATAQATVTVDTFTISLAPNPMNIGVGVTSNMTVSLNNPAPVSTTVALTSANPALATVTPSVVFSAGTTTATAVVTGIAAGTTTITAGPVPSLGNAQATATVTVTPYTVTLTPNPMTLLPGATATLTATLNNAAASGHTTQVVIGAVPPGIAVLGASTLTFPPGSTVATTVVTAVGAGTATVPVSLQIDAVPISTSNWTVTTLSTLTMTANPTSIDAWVGGLFNVQLTLSAPAPAAITVPLTVVGPQGVVTVPASVGFAPGATTAQFTVSADQVSPNAVASTVVATLPGQYGGDQASVSVTVRLPLTFTPLTLSVAVGQTANVIVTMAAAQPVATVVTLTFAGTPAGAVTFPATVTIPAFTTFTTFTVTGVSETSGASITGTLPPTLPQGLGGATAILPVTVTP